jgi:periplasmic protein TonB
MTDIAAASLPRFSSTLRQHRSAPSRSPGVAIAILVHLVALYFVWTARTELRTAPPAPLQVTLIETVKPPPPLDVPPPPPPPTLAAPPPPYIPPPEIVIQTPPPVAPVQQATTIKPAVPVSVAPPAPVVPAPVAPAPVAPPVKVEPDLDTAHSSEPEYPSMSRRLREEGLVGLLVLVEADGSVSDVRIELSSGHDRLDQAAATAAKTRSRFKPGTLDGKPARMWYRYRYTFKLT